MKNKKGFTLVEMIVVIAIIGILLAVLVPTWSYFIMRANVRSQNNYSKVIFNAAQTQATREKFIERAEFNKVSDLTLSNEERKAAADKLFVGKHADFFIYWNGHKGVALNWNDGETVDTTIPQDKVDSFVNAVNKVFSHEDDTVYKIYIKDYKVESVCSAVSENTENIGSYPEIQEGRSRNQTVKSYNMRKINLDSTDDDYVPNANANANE